MKYIWLIFLIPITTLILSALIKAFSTSQGQKLQNKFASLGHLKGKTFNEIRSIVGDPQSITDLGNGTILHQWIMPGFHIALLFDDKQICLGIDSQFKTNEL